MKKKYEFTDEFILFGDEKLYRIRALKDFGSVRKGDLGGYIQDEKNLSHAGDAWVSGNAKVLDGAWVCDDARVEDNALVVGSGVWICNNAIIRQNATVIEDAHVEDNVIVEGNARISGCSSLSDDVIVGGNIWFEDACIETMDDYIYMNGFNSEFGSATFYRAVDENIRVIWGIFQGTLEEFREQVKAYSITNTDKYEKEYLMIADLVEMHFTF